MAQNHRFGPLIFALRVWRYQPPVVLDELPPETAAATSNNNSNGTMTPPEEDEVAAATTSSSITGSAMPPANAVDADTVRARASAIFFILVSNRVSTDTTLQSGARKTRISFLAIAFEHRMSAPMPQSAKISADKICQPT